MFFITKIVKLHDTILLTLIKTMRNFE